MLHSLEMETLIYHVLWNKIANRLVLGSILQKRYRSVFKSDHGEVVALLLVDVLSHLNY